jgi:hypothetical protein
VQQQIGDLEKGRVLCQLLDGIAAILENALIAIDIGNGAATRSSIEEPWVVACQPWAPVNGDLP